MELEENMKLLHRDSCLGEWHVTSVDCWFYREESRTAALLSSDGELGRGSGHSEAWKSEA